MPRGQRNTPAAPAAERAAAVRKSPQEKAQDAFLKAFQAHDAAQNTAIEADKTAAKAWEHVKYTQRVRDHAAYHPDLPEDFDGEAFVAERQGVTAETAGAPIEPEPTVVEKAETGPDPARTAAGQEAVPTDTEDDDPFAGIG